MDTCLILTVGGSCAPVVTAIKDYAPDHVLFLASAGSKGSSVTVNGPGDPCGDSRKLTCPHCGKTFSAGDPTGPNIATQVGLQEGRYTLIELEDPDSFSDCYKGIREALDRAFGQREGWRWIADYTGGTKTMSVALAIAAMELGMELSLVKGARTNLVKVLDGTEMAGLVNVWEVRARQRVTEGQRLFNEFACESAGQLLESLLREAPLSAELQRQVREQVALCRAFDAWDRFDHRRARTLLEPYQSKALPQFLFLKTILGEKRGSGYESVFDLMLNAERRAVNGRCDDAVARLYRALELLAQTRLKQLSPPLDTSDLSIEPLPETLRPKYMALRDQNMAQGRGAKVKIGLLEAYELLAELHDPLGLAYGANKGSLLATLESRNDSILAHGLTPLGRADYEAMRARIEELIEAGLKALGIKRDGIQFPRLEAQGIVQR